MLHVAIAIEYFLKVGASFTPQRVGIDLRIMEANKVVKDGKRSCLSYHNLILSTPCSPTPMYNLRATNILPGQNVLGPELVKNLVTRNRNPSQISYRQTNK